MIRRNTYSGFIIIIACPIDYSSDVYRVVARIQFRFSKQN